MGCRAQPVRYPISRTVQKMTRETRMGQPSYTEFRILPISLIHDLTEDTRPAAMATGVNSYPQLRLPPEANCARYDQLMTSQEAPA